MNWNIISSFGLASALVMFVILLRKHLTIKLKWLLLKDKDSYGVFKIVTRNGRVRSHIVKLENPVEVEKKAYQYEPGMPHVIEDNMPTYYFRDDDMSPIDVRGLGELSGIDPRINLEIIKHAKELDDRKTTKLLEICLIGIAATVIVSILTLVTIIQNGGIPAIA